MSEFCIGIIRKKYSLLEQEKVLEQMNHITGYQFPYVMLYQQSKSFLSEAERQKFMVVKFCCSKWDDTCEKLLISDWCNMEQKNNRLSLKTRLNSIQKVLMFCVKQFGPMDLWIGGIWGDGDEEEYETVEITADSFVEIISLMYKNECGCIPEVHFVVS